MGIMKLKGYTFKSYHLKQGVFFLQKWTSCFWNIELKNAFSNFKLYEIDYFFDEQSF